ncbi:MAG: hypothetical protein JST86_02525 [Bacteroidetes bacterium]|nr:hypothetical protein [Bacteroidota bacterium]
MKKTLYLKAYALVCKLNLARLSKIKKDNRPVSPFKLVFFCGKTGIEYLNASLVSVYKSWNNVPEVIIITDGTPAEIIQQKLIQWPQPLTIHTWQHCGEYFKQQGKNDLYEYAAKDIWGKKFIGICYCAEQFPILYSDTDILWFNTPVLENLDGITKVKMCQDVDHHYSLPLVEAMQQQKVLQHVPLNAGLIYAGGHLESFPQWQALTHYLAEKPDHRTEQTSFAVLNNYFNPGDYFKQEEIFIDVEDMYSMKYTKKKHPAIWARHYVNLKNTSFWRDFIYLLRGK